MANFVDKAKNFVAEKVGNIEKPEATVADVDLADVSRDCVTYNAKVAVRNPYGHPIPICDISYTFKAAGRVVASGDLPDPGSLRGNDTTMLNVPVKVPYSALMSLGRDIGSDWDIDYELELGLTIDLPVIGSFTIPLSSKGEIKLPKLSDLWK